MPCRVGRSRTVPGGPTSGAAGRRFSPGFSGVGLAMAVLRTRRRRPPPRAPPTELPPRPGPASSPGAELVAGAELKVVRRALPPTASSALDADRRQPCPLLGGARLLASGTAKHPGFLAMQADGDLVIYRATGRSGARSATAGQRRRLNLSSRTTATSPSTRRPGNRLGLGHCPVGLQAGAVGPAVTGAPVYLTVPGLLGGPAPTGPSATRPTGLWRCKRPPGLPPTALSGRRQAARWPPGVPKPRSTSGYVVEVDLQDDLLMVAEQRQTALHPQRVHGRRLHLRRPGRDLRRRHADRRVPHLQRDRRARHRLAAGRCGGRGSSRAVSPSMAIPSAALPVSHGCVRVSDEAIDWIWAANTCSLVPRCGL